MSHKLQSILFTILATSIVSLMAVQTAHSQDPPFMSPYESDSNTVVLMHFDGNLDNESPMNVGDGVGHGKIQYNTNNIEGFGNMVRLNNSTASDSSWIHIADTAALDMTGSWTIEFWVNVFTFGETRDDWRERPKVVAKAALPEAGNTGYLNYQAVIDGSNRRFNAMWYTESGGGDWIPIKTRDNVFQTGTWYHGTYIRDTTEQLQSLMVHNKNGELIAYEASPYDSTQDPPRVTEGDLKIGVLHPKSSTWLDGFLDELRISNTVRNFDSPPVLSGLSNVDNMEESGSATVKLQALNVADNEVDQATLHYNTGSGWQTTTMSWQSSDTLMGQIPSVSKGTSVEYFATVSNTNGLSTSIPTGASESSGPYQNYAVVGDREIINWDFEDGEDVELPPTDNSMLTQWTVGGQPQIADQGANGTNHSLYLEGDSSYMMAENPDAAFLKSEDFVFDTWIKPDSAMGSRGTRIMIKESVPPGDNFFQFSFHFGGGSALRLASWFPGADFNRSGNYMHVGLIDTLTIADHWWRYVGIVNSSNDTLSFRLYDSDNELVGKFGAGLDPEIDAYASNGPLMVGVKQDALPLGPFYRGYLDEVKFYNYIPDSYKGSGTPIEEPADLPKRVSLDQNYPNPFNPTTKIQYSLPSAKEVSLQVYDVLGREVATLVDKKQKAGSYTVTFDAKELSSGVYFYRLKTQNTNKVRKMMLIK